MIQHNITSYKNNISYHTITQIEGEKEKTPIVNTRLHWYRSHTLPHIPKFDSGIN
jgi:hypothetical protein